jgi:LysM repeat protein
MYESGIYGIWYPNASDRRNGRKYKRMFFGALFAAAVVTSCIASRRNPGDAAPGGTDGSAIPQQGGLHRDLPDREPPPVDKRAVRSSEAARNAAVANAVMRPGVPPPSHRNASASPSAGSSLSREVRLLLERLRVAEAASNRALAVDAIEKLLARDDTAALRKALAGKLSRLNTAALYNPQSFEWMKQVVVKNGDNVDRIARENETTSLAVMKLNGISNPRHLAVGRKLRVLDHPRVSITVNKAGGFAEMFLNGKLFKRYKVKVPASSPEKEYEITRSKGPSALISALGLQLSQDDAVEWRMMLAPGAKIKVVGN